MSSPTPAPPRTCGNGDQAIALDYAKEELVVEAVTYAVAGAIGLRVDGYAIPYLASWSEDTACRLSRTPRG